MWSKGWRSKTKKGSSMSLSDLLHACMGNQGKSLLLDDVVMAKKWGQQKSKSSIKAACETKASIIAYLGFRHMMIMWSMCPSYCSQCIGLKGNGMAVFACIRCAFLDTSATDWQAKIWPWPTKNCSGLLFNRFFLLWLLKVLVLIRNQFR